MNADGLDVQTFLQSLSVHLLALSQAVAQNDIQAIAHASEGVRRDALDLHTLIHQEPHASGEMSSAVIGALKPLVKQLSDQRAGLNRRAALIDQALQAMVPGACRETYGSQAPYGGARKQTGAFKTLAA